MWRTGECGGKGGVVDRWVRRTGGCGGQVGKEDR